MPGYYSRGPMAGQLPITPPDSGSGYAYTSMHYAQDPYAPQSVNQCRPDNGFDYQQQAYMQPPVAPAPPTYQYQQNSYQASASLPPIQGYYEPIGAPILPPLRIHDHVPFSDDYQRRLQQEQQDAALREQQRQAAKEEKATGGVSAKLDYDMDRMTDFVATSVHSIFQTSQQAHPSFRKWVHQVLSATRLPSATIQLSLHYLNDRYRRFPATIPNGENQIYRLLAVALILGSKFLDDNTFINRSWSDVTAIKVAELNHLEMKWLSIIDCRLHVDHEDPAGFMAWRNYWESFNADCDYAAKTQLARLSPLDTNVHRHTSNSRDRYSPYPTPQTATPSYSRSFDAPVSARTSQYSTPYSASDPWAANHRPAEDFYKRQDRYPSQYEVDEANQRASEERARQSAYSYGQTHSYYATPGWEQYQPYDCNAYGGHYRPYPMTSTYAPQPVMG